MNRYELKGQWYTTSELSEMSGIREHTIRDRIRRGYSPDEAVKIVATNDSVREFGEASCYEDWIGVPMNNLYEIYWKWAMSNGYSPTSKQGFSRHLRQLYPMLKTVPTRREDGCYRIIRLR